MRRLMWTTIGFTAGCGLLAYGMEKPWLMTTGAVLVLFLVGVLAFSRKKPLLGPGIALLLGIALSLGWFGTFHHLYLRPLRTLEREITTLTITATEQGYKTGWGTGVSGVAVIAGKPYQLRVYFQTEEPVSPGDMLEGTFRLRLTTGEDSPSPYFQGKGIFLLAYQQGSVCVTDAPSMPWWCYPAVLRQEIARRLEDLFPADTAPFAKALLLGDSRDLDYETDSALKLSGIRHIIAVSGLHVSILYGAISMLTLRRRFLTALVAMPALLLFAGVAGFTPSVIRACLMVWLMLLANVFDRSYDSATALSFAVLVLLLLNPMAVTDASLQLSAGCVAGILLFRESLYRWLCSKVPGRRRLRRAILTGLSVTVSAMSLVTPLCAWYFGAVSLSGLVTNVLTLWVVNLLFFGIIAVCLLSLVTPAAAVVAGLLSWPIRYVLTMAKLLSSVPLAAVYTRDVHVVCWLVLVYGLLGCFLLEKEKKPERLLWRGALGLCVMLAASWLGSLRCQTSITMLDVGQGQSILLQAEGKTFLVDCGGESDETTADMVAETLLSQGISRLDGIILTHYDRDHSGALANLLTRVETDLLFVPDIQHDVSLPETTGQTICVWEDLEVSLGRGKLQIFGPVYSGASNENSLCVLFDTENCDILITGDRSAWGEAWLLRRRSVPEVDILVAGHHGDADSTSEALLGQTRPDTVLISVSRDNVYGHPAPELLQRLEEFGCTVRRTDQEGTIIIRR